MNDRNLAILIGVCVTLAIGVLMYRAWFTEPPPAPVVTQPVEAPKRVTAVRATMTDCQKSGSRTVVEGIVHNLGTTTLNSVTVQTIWKDDNRTILDTGLVYAVSESAPLEPGQRRTFTDTTDLRNASFCNVRALDWWASDGK